jgi:hypothetical protein
VSIERRVPARLWLEDGRSVVSHVSTLDGEWSPWLSKSATRHGRQVVLFWQLRENSGVGIAEYDWVEPVAVDAVLKCAFTGVITFLLIHNSDGFPLRIRAHDRAELRTLFDGTSPRHPGVRWEDIDIVGARRQLGALPPPVPPVRPVGFVRPGASDRPAAAAPAEGAESPAPVHARAAARTHSIVGVRRGAASLWVTPKHARARNS